MRLSHLLPVLSLPLALLACNGGKDDTAPGGGTGDADTDTDTDPGGTGGDEPVDADGDGYFSDVDCDDANPDVYPGADDTYGDGIDGDCDGMDCQTVEAAGHRYVACTGGLDQSGAQAQCVSAGYDGLATIISRTENTAVASGVEAIGTRAWIGFTDGATEGTWAWVSGVPARYSRWYDGAGGGTAQPSGDGNCALMFASTDPEPRPSRWNDVPCSNTEESPFTYGFVCETRTTDCPLGSAPECPARSCADILAVQPSSTDGTYWLEGGAVAGAPFEAHCLMDAQYDGGGWTLVATFSDDNVATWTWNNRHLLDTDTTTFGDLAEIDKDFKSPAYHDVLGAEAMFLHAPSGIWASYVLAGGSETTIGALVEIAGGPSSLASGTGIPMNAGTLTVVENLCETSLYFNAIDRDGAYPANTWGPTWNSGFNNGCPFDDPGNASVGPTEWEPNREMASLEGSPPAGAGFGYAIGENPEPYNTGAIHLQAWHR